MPPIAVWITRVQAVGLLALAIVVVVLAATSTTSLGPGFVVAEVAAALLGAVLFGVGTRYRQARTPILLLEIIAVGVSVQLASAGRLPIGLAVGIPALVAAGSILLGAREG